MKFLKDSLKVKYLLVLIIAIAIIFSGSLFLFYQILNNFFNYQKKLVQDLLIEETKSTSKTNLQIVQDFIDNLYEISAIHYTEAIKEHLKLQAQLFHKILNIFYTQHKNKMSEKELEKQVLELIKKINKGHKEVYFFVLNDKGILLEHPYETQLIGKNVREFRDIEGKYFVKEILNLAKEKGEGFVTYFWPNYLKNTPEKKITYIFLFKPFSWIIATGVHPEKFLQPFELSIQEKMKDILREVRFGKDKTGYFWIMDTTGKIIMHPVSPNLENKTSPIAKIILKQLGERDKGFVVYKWPKPGEKIYKEKISYLVKLKDWNWIIGTGGYIEDINQKIKKIEIRSKNKIKKLLIISILFIALISAFSLILLKFFGDKFIFSRLKSLKNFLEKIKEGNFSQASFSEELNFSKNSDEIDELQKIIFQICEGFNKFKEEINQLLLSLEKYEKREVNLFKFKGEYREILQNIYKIYTGVFQAIDVIEDFAISLESGALKKSPETSELMPIFQTIVERLDVAKQNLERILSEIRNILKKIEEGKFNIEVDEKDFKGVYKFILLDIHEIIKQFQKILTEINTTAQEVLKGNLNVSIPEDKFKGEYKNIITSLNQILIQLKKYIYDLQKVLERERELLELRRVIEEDQDIQESFKRISHLLKNKFNIHKFVLYEIEENIMRNVVFSDGEMSRYCKEEVYSNPKLCRANRLGQTIIGISYDWGGECEFFKYEICQNCYLCIPFIFEEKAKYVLQIITEDEKELQQILETIENIHTYLNTILPIIEIKKLLYKFEEKSVRDALTNLYNRYFLNEYIKKAAELALRTGHNIGILLIDIDYFKKVNDTYGHQAGDIVLKEIAKILENSFRKSDIIVRYGGEEFLVLLHNVDEEKIVDLAETIRKKVEEKEFNISENTKIKVTISIGISIFPKDSKDIWETIKLADKALYLAKNQGKNRAIRYSKEIDNLIPSL